MARSRTSSRNPQILGIACPKCGSKYNNVIVTERRPSNVRRQGICSACSHLWRTEEWNEGRLSENANAKAGQLLLLLQKQILALADAIKEYQE